MGSPCEILVAAERAEQALRHAQPGIDEACRIEAKFSRYRSDSVVAAINASQGRPVAVDEETDRLLEFAARCFTLSEGLFDITSGVLRRAWRFDGSNRIPTQAQIDPLLELIGFERLQRQANSVIVPPGMEIDLGGIAKEYAVDRALEAIGTSSAPAGEDGSRRIDLPVLVNFGGDLRANRAPGEAPWQVALENPQRVTESSMLLELTRGALATSGDAHRRIEHGAARYGHILNPRTGWPVVEAPRSVTVAAATCVQAGTLSTIAVLHGAGAETFLEQFSVRFWCLR